MSLFRRFISPFVVLAFLPCITLAQQKNNPVPSIMLWGSTHPIMLYAAEDACSKQPKIAYSVAKDYESSNLPQYFPKFIYGTESVDTEDLNNLHLVGLDDPTLKTYVGLYITTGIVLDRLKTLFAEPYNPANEQVLFNLVGTYYSFIFATDESDSNYDQRLYQSAKTIIAQDSNQDYFKALQGDLDMSLNLNGARAPSQNGLLFYISRKWKNDGSQPNVQPMISAVAQLSQRIASDYFNRYMNTKTASIKYNLVIDMPGSSSNGQRFFSIGAPEKLFAKTNFDSKMNELISTTWRDVFIAKNVIKTILKNPDTNLLLWFGINHMPGVVHELLKSNDLSDVQKAQIQVTTSHEQSEIACNLDSVLNTMHTKTGKSMVSWNQLFGIREPNKLTIYSLEGKIVYTDLKYYGPTTKHEIDSYLELLLNKNNIPNGIYVVNVQDPKGKNIDAHKMMLSN